MRFSIWPSTGRPWHEILELARHCEATGWDGVYLADHFMPHGDLGSADVDQTVALDGDKLECWSVLAALAATVPRVRLGTLVSGNTYRHPAVLANIAAAVDRISDGRVVLGLGAGWQVNEHVAYGIELGAVGERLDRLEEACEVVTSLLRQPRTTFAGQHYRLADAPNQPAPVQARLPLLVGGGGERRTLRIVARWADMWNTWALPDLLARKRSVLHGHCDALGRDPAEIAVSTQAQLFLSTDTAWVTSMRDVAPPGLSLVGTPSEVADVVGRYQESGADELVVPDRMAPLDEWKATCDLFIEEVARSFRGTGEATAP
jgi:F420-dependent oxidoreductase-like protein